MLGAVSKTKSVGLRGTEIWVYDASLSLVLAEVIRAVDAMPPQDRPPWWAAVEYDLRVHTIISDFYLDLDLGLTDEQREEFAQLLVAAADRVRRRVFTLEEASAWRIIDEHSVIFRGVAPEETGPAAELGEALASMIRGTLPAAPPHTWWYYGPPGGRSTIRRLVPDEDTNRPSPEGTGGGASAAS